MLFHFPCFNHVTDVLEENDEIKFVGKTCSARVMLSTGVISHKFLARHKDTGILYAVESVFSARRLLPLVSTFQGRKMLAETDVSSPPLLPPKSVCGQCRHRTHSRRQQWNPQRCGQKMPDCSPCPQSCPSWRCPSLHRRADRGHSLSISGHFGRSCPSGF